MEVVAAVSSVAGIATLVGQSLSGLSSLYNFFKDCREVSKTADHFLRAVTSLESSIKQVESLITSVKGISDTSTEGVLASLAIHVEDCAKDIGRWLREAQSCHPGYGAGTKAMFKRFLVAVKKESIKDVFQEMAAHKASISLSLSTTGRLLDVQKLNKVDGLRGKVDEIVDYGVVTVKALGRLECRYERTNTPEHEVLHTSRSLSSIASQLSRVESPLSVGAGSASSPVAPTYAGLPGLARTGSTSSLYGIYSDSPVMASGSRWNSTSELPIGASKDKCQVGQLCRLSKDEVEILERHFQEEHKPSSNTKRQLAGRMGAEISRINNWFQNRRGKAKQEKKQIEFSLREAGTLAYSEPSSTQWKHFQTDRAQNEPGPDEQRWCQLCLKNIETEHAMSFHTSCIHRYDQGWSCSALTDHTSVFYFSPEDPFGNVTCGFCGAKFCAITAVNSQDSDILVEHAKSVHRFAECNMAEKFAEKLLFHEHLINAHDATLGPWTEMLEDACYYQIFSSLPSMKATADLGRTLETQEAVSTTEIKHTILQPFAIDLEPRVDLLLSKTESPFSLGGQLGTTDAAAILDFNAFESLIAQAGGSTSENLMEYLRYNQMTETIRVHVRMISALTAHLGIAETSFEKLKSQQAYWEILGSLKSIESEKDRYRQACWSEGYDVDEIDRMLKTSERYETVSNTSSDIYQEPESEQHMSWWDVLHHTGPQNWLTKKDRINSWLLQNLAAQPKEALCHRKYLQDQGADDQLSEEEWARLVLKFWTLDDAARPSEDADCSTNGAVDSDGACHSARVKLVESLPVREKWDLVDIVSKSETSTVDL